MFVKIFTLTLLVFLSFDLNEAQSNLNRCDGVPDNQFLRDYTNCQGYIICIDNQPVNGLCPHGFYFEENGQTCDFSHEVPCIVCDPNGVYNTALANSCEQYILCYNGTGSIHNCAEGLSFSPENGICIKDEFNDCIDGLCPAIILDNVVLNIPSRQGCDVFYRCTNSGNTTMHCPPGLQFNSVSNRCDLISNVVCENGEAIPFCPPTGFHFIANPDDCNSHYICFEGSLSGTTLSCALDMIFDIHTSHCQVRGPKTQCIKDL